MAWWGILETALPCRACSRRTFPWAPSHHLKACPQGLHATWRHLQVSLADLRLPDSWVLLPAWAAFRVLMDLDLGSMVVACRLRRPTDLSGATRLMCAIQHAQQCLRLSFLCQISSFTAIVYEQSSKVCHENICIAQHLLVPSDSSVPARDVAACSDIQYARRKCWTTRRWQSG